MTTDETARLGADDTQAGQYLADGQAETPVPTGARAPSEDADPVDLALENKALAAENAQLKSAAQHQRIGNLVSELRFLGKLTPGLEQAGAVQILQAAYALGQQVIVNQPDGSELSLGDALANLLYAIPPSWSGGSEGFGGAGLRARHASGDQDAGRGTRPTGVLQTSAYDDYVPLPPRLSAQEREVARTLGLTAEEYASVISNQ